MASASTSNNDPLSEFFANYPRFDYDPREPPNREFHRMCLALNIPRDWEDEERMKAWKGFSDALALTFNRDFGKDVNSLASWQALCVRIQIDPVPDTLAECMSVVEATHVNLVDLVDQNEATVQKFSSVESLRDYSVDNHKIFPKESAYAGELLRYLLREFFNPHLGRKWRGRGRGRGGGNGRGRGRRNRGRSSSV